MNEFLIGRVQQDSGWWYGIWHTVEYCTVGSQALLRETIFGEEDEKWWLLLLEGLSLF